MKTQTAYEHHVKERIFYFPTTFDKLAEIVRSGLTTETGEDGIKFYPNSQTANEAADGRFTGQFKNIVI